MVPAFHHQRRVQLEREVNVLRFFKQAVLQQNDLTQSSFHNKQAGKQACSVGGLELIRFRGPLGIMDRVVGDLLTACSADSHHSHTLEVADQAVRT